MDELVYQKIDSYLDGTLSPETVISFEKEMRVDINLRQAVAEVVAMKLALGESLEAEKTKNAQSLPLNNRYWLYAAAAAILLLFAFFFWPQSQEQPEPLALYEQYYEAAQLPAFRSEEADSIWQLALESYTQKQYAASIPLFEATLTDSSFELRESAYLGLGIAQLEHNMPKAALSSFEAITITSALGPEAQWYQALTLIRLSRLDDAKEVLMKINNDPRHFKQKAADNLLKAIQF